MFRTAQRYPYRSKSSCPDDVFRFHLKVILCFLHASILFTALNPALAQNNMQDRMVQWEASYDLDEELFTAEFERFSGQGLMLVDLSVYQRGEQLYATIWHQNTDSRGWSMRRDMDALQFNQRYQRLKNDGYRPLDIEIYHSDAGLMFADIWVENRERDHWAIRHNLKIEEYDEHRREQHNSGLRLADIEFYQLHGEEFIAVVWEASPGSDGDWNVFYGMSSTVFEQQRDALNEQKRRIRDFEINGDTGGFRFSFLAEGVESERAVYHRYGLTAMEFGNELRRRKDEGYRLADVEVYGPPSDIRYAGLWTENDLRYHFTYKNEISARARAYQLEHDVAGLSVAIILNGDEVFRGGFGLAGLQSGKQVHSRSIYPLNQISQTISAGLALKLAQEGRLSNDQQFSLDLSNRSSTYLTHLPNQHKHQVNELLAHTGCIPNYDETGVSERHHASATSAASSFWDRNILPGCTAGQQFNYSPYSYTLLGAVLESVTSRNVKQLIRNEITRPLRLRSLNPLFSNPQPIWRQERVRLYTQGRQPFNTRNNSWKLLAEGLEMDAVDLARFAWLLMKGDFVTDQTRENRLWSPAIPEVVSASASGAGNGYGWQLWPDGSDIMAWQSGYSNGAQGTVRVYRDAGLVISILSNQAGHNPEELADGIADIILSEQQE
jgi:CubicO group peptidase (beta-lactamase class C family)